MKASDRRKGYAEALKKRQEDSYSRKDDSGKYKTIWGEGKKLPFWKCTDAEHSINIIPFYAGKNHPYNIEGEPTYLLDAWVHYKVGANEDSYICLNRMYKEACPICEYQTKLRKAANDSDDPESFKKEIDALNPKRRAIYNIQCLDSNKEIDKGVQVWDVSHFLFERELLEISRKKRGGGFVYFSDPDDGKIISFIRKGSGPTTTEFAAIEFEERDEVISDELLDAAYPLDELVHRPSYAEVKAAFLGIPIAKVLDEDKEDTSSRKSKRNAPKEEDVDDDTDEDVDDDIPDDDDTDEDIEDEELPDDVCPSNHDFAADFDKTNDCEGCPNFNTCKVENKKMKKYKLEDKSGSSRRRRS